MDTGHLIIVEGGMLCDIEESQLPFLASETRKIGWGGYSTVFRDVIAPYGYEQSSDTNMTTKLNEAPFPIARKRYPARVDFEREVKILNILRSSSKSHERILMHLATITTRDTYSIILPLADMDLAQFLREARGLNLIDLIRESSELSDAIVFLHQNLQTSTGVPLICCHMDLKPENILVFLDISFRKPVGTWKLTDFSVSTIRDVNGRDLIKPLRHVPETYQAPEVDGSKAFKSQLACDIWSFGCILFEVLVTGSKVESHMEMETKKPVKVNAPDGIFNLGCYYVGPINARVVDPCVLGWLGQESDNGQFEHVIYMFKNLILDMLKIDPAERMKDYEVSSRLRDIEYIAGELMTSA